MFNFPNEGHLPNVWRFQKEAHKNYHPTEKPLIVMEHPIKHSSRIGAIILDYFVGTGTTLVASENLSRRCYAAEISPAYVAVTLQRMSDAFPELVIERIDG